MLQLCLTRFMYRGSKERLAAFVGVWSEELVRWSTRPKSATRAIGDSDRLA